MAHIQNIIAIGTSHRHHAVGGKHQIAGLVVSRRSLVVQHTECRCCRCRVISVCLNGRRLIGREKGWRCRWIEGDIGTTFVSGIIVCHVVRCTIGLYPHLYRFIGIEGINARRSTRKTEYLLIADGKHYRNVFPRPVLATRRRYGTNLTGAILCTSTGYHAQQQQ